MPMADDLNKIFADQKLPFLFAGDFNAQSGSPTIEQLSQTCDFHQEAFKNEFTFLEEKKPAFKIDWIASDKSGAWSVKEAYAANKMPNAPPHAVSTHVSTVVPPTPIAGTTSLPEAPGHSQCGETDTSATRTVRQTRF